MRLGIIGTGNMGRSLGILWAKAGHEVFFGARDVNKAKAAAELADHNSQFGTNDEAAKFGNVLLYTARDVSPEQVFSDASLLNGKIIIDCNNDSIPEDFDYSPITISLAEKLQQQIPQATVVKAFNTFAQEVFELAPTPLDQHHVSCFVCSDNQTAKTTVMKLAEEIGFAGIDCGELRRSRLLEGLGNFIRFMIAGKQLGSYTTVSIDLLPTATQTNLGGRQASKFG